ncbi:het domain protein [Diplodia corticola]|uniref:Het domain protein n=1 Tax=Diplodia corticola TaxID=236234 RepID=A0A1J9S612_9PEZI|nr:het domain protein [Diplodia corticola]OJD35959.1 het domain protein [Diplodia corticola]
MDHLLVPKHPARPAPKVRYYCRQEYDGGDFLTYPERMGWIDDGDTWLDLSDSHDVDEASAFLQQWLFFGLLHEFFGELADFSAFIETDSSSGIVYVHTRELLPMARAWLERERAEKRLALQGARLKQCLKKTYSIYHAVTDEQDEFLDPYLQLSLVATSRFLTHVASLLYPDEFPQAPWTLPCVKFDEGRLANAKDVNNDMDILGVEMVQSGWCPRQVGIAERCSFETYYFCSRLRMGRPPDAPRHDSCTQLQCLALQVESGTYATKHVRPGCSCPWLSPSTDAVCAILRAGRIPLVAFDPSTDTLALSSTTTTTSPPPPRYTALSHIWSDGLGNPSANALPRCQLRRIAAVVASTTSGSQHEPPPPRPQQQQQHWFWLDTLLCPVGGPDARDARLLAIQRMRQTYALSARVLVLAADLQATSTSTASIGTSTSAAAGPAGDDDSAEALLPVMDKLYLTALSNWTSRLWTLQEGALGRGPLDVLFGDGVVWGFDDDVDGEAGDLGGEADAWGLGRVDAVDWGYMVGLVRGDVDMGELQAGQPVVVDTTPRRFSLRHASVAVARRATSVREDEALCLGSLLEADMRAITRAPRRDRMKALWASLPVVPREVLFLREATMGEAGWRWAPRSFLGVPNAGNGVVLGTEGTARVTAEGLRTVAHGFDLDGLVCPLRRGVLRLREKGSGAVYSLIKQAPLLRGGAEQFEQAWTVPDGEFMRIALVVEDREIGRGGKYCCMVFVWKEEDEVAYARRGDAGFITSRDVAVDWESDGSSDEEAEACFEDPWSNDIYAEVTGTLQKEPQAWCID